MTGARTTEAVATSPASAGDAATTADEAIGFGAEFRELARQRRFVRSAADEPAPASDWRSAAAATAPPATAPKASVPTATAPTVAQQHRAGSRISDDQRAVLAELARMSDRLVESREQLAAVTARAERAEAELTSANDRLMAARALVHDAQRATHETAERCAWLEGRCEALQEALDLAVNANMLTRWRWRRQQRARG